MIMVDETERFTHINIPTVAHSLLLLWYRINYRLNAQIIASRFFIMTRLNCQTLNGFGGIMVVV